VVRFKTELRGGHNGDGCTAKLQYSHNLTDWYDSSFSYSTHLGISCREVIIDINNLSAPTTYFAWVMDGDHAKYSQWFVDDVEIYHPVSTDLTATSVQGDYYGFVGDQLTHTVNIRNNALQPADNYTVYLKDQNGNILSSQ